MSKLKRWIGRRIWPNSVRCPEEEHCLELARIMLDEESTPEDDQYVLNHIDGCYQCYDNYNVERAIRDAVKRKTSRLKVPDDVIEEIKKKIEVA